MEIKWIAGKFYIGDDPKKVQAEMTYVLNIRDQLIIEHTEVGEELRGKGAGDKLLDKVVQFARDDNRQVIAECPFVKARFEKYPDKYGDLIEKR